MKRKPILKTGWKDIEEFLNKFGANNRPERDTIGLITDDCSMAKCLADSFLVNDFKLVPKDLRLRFLLWWHFGYNNGSHN